MIKSQQTKSSLSTIKTARTSSPPSPKLSSKTNYEPKSPILQQQGQLSDRDRLSKTPQSLIHKKMGGSGQFSNKNGSENVKLSSSMNKSTKSEQMPMDDLKIITQPLGSKRCTIKRLGLNLRPKCSFETHNDLEITHICIDQACKQQEKFCCTKCGTDVHKGHLRTELQSFAEGVDEQWIDYQSKTIEFQSYCLMIEQPPFMGIILKELSNLKEYICKQINKMKEELIKVYKKNIIPQVQKMRDEVSNQEKIVEQMAKILQKNIFDLNNKEIQTSTKMQSKQIQQKLQDLIKDSLFKYSKLEKQIIFQYKTFKSNIFFDLELSFKEFLLPSDNLLSEDSDHPAHVKKKIQINSYQEALSVMKQKNEKITNYRAKSSNQKSPSFRQQTAKNMSLTKNQSDSKDNDKSNLPIKQDQKSNSNTIKSENEGKPRNNRVERLKIAIQEIDQDIKEKKRMLKKLREFIFKPQAVKDKEVSELTKFPYYTYFEATCEHLIGKPKSNSIPIFNCCKQAYRCVKCHDKYCDHIAQLSKSNNSQRYCVKCFEVFNVDFKEDVLVCCAECKELPDE